MSENDFIDRLAELRYLREVSSRRMSLSLGHEPDYIYSIEYGSYLPTMKEFFDYHDIFAQEHNELMKEHTKIKLENTEIVNSLNELKNAITDIKKEINHYKATELQEM